MSLSGDLKRLWSAAFFTFFGFGIYSACTTNFATEIIHITPLWIGRVEAVRELPGFLSVFVAALTMRIAEPLLGAIALTLLAGGIAAYATVQGMPSFLAWSLVWSVGIHTWMPVASSMTLNLADEGSKGKQLGKMNAFGSVGSLLGMITVAKLAHNLSYQTWFIAAGIMITVGAAIVLTMRRDIGKMDKPRLVWKPKFRRYYILSLLEGGRRQVFFTFAPYTLAKVYNAPLELIAKLFVINGIVSFIGAPLIGQLIDKIRERRILLVSYTCLIAVFLCYALVKQRYVLCALYCLDNLLFLSTTCLTTYVQRIASPKDLMPTLSMGVTMNHVAAVMVPLIGGMLWSRFSYPVMFFAGAAIVLISLFSVVGMKENKVANV